MNIEGIGGEVLEKVVGFIVGVICLREIVRVAAGAPLGDEIAVLANALISVFDPSVTILVMCAAAVLYYLDEWG